MTGKKTSHKLHLMKKSNLGEAYKESGVKSEEEVLLLNTPKETDSVARALGVKLKKDFVNEQLKDVTTTSAYESQYENYEAFLGKDIKKLCNTYDLKCIPLSNMKRYIEEKHLVEVNKFTELFEKALTDSYFLVIAPSEYFHNKDKGKLAETFIIVYRPDKRDHYTSEGLQEEEIAIQITSSGNDFDECRKWNKYLSNDPKISIFSKLISFLIIILLTIFNAYLSFQGVANDLLIFIFICTLILYGIVNIEFPLFKYWNRKN